MEAALLTKVERPLTLDGIVGQPTVVSLLKAMVKRPEQAVNSHILAGPYGCGKTTACRAFAHDLFTAQLSEHPHLASQIAMLVSRDYAPMPNYLELDSTDIRDTEAINRVKQQIDSVSRSFKVIVFDEFHVMDQSIQSSLLKVLEDSDPSKLFFFSTTEPDKLLRTIKSRSLTHHFRLAQYSEMAELLNKLCEKYNVSYGQRTQDLLISRAGGHYRDLVMAFQVLQMQGESEWVTSHIDTLEVFASLAQHADQPELWRKLEAVAGAYLIADLESFIYRQVIPTWPKASVAKLLPFYIKAKQSLPLPFSDTDVLIFLTAVMRACASLPKA